MVLAYHAIFACYGFWLPNEQRGSWSTEVWAKHLRPFGPATKTSERRSLANRPYDRDQRRAARASLLYPPVRFTGVQARAVARGFASIVDALGLVVYACAIMPDHVHIVLARHGESIESVVGFLKRAATRQLTREGLHPLGAFRRANGRIPTPWVVGGWSRYLNAEPEIVDASDYVVHNPERIGFKRQTWSFVVPFVD
jgi:REP element-mobilizing transposase RayT